MEDGNSPYRSSQGSNNNDVSTSGAGLDLTLSESSHVTVT